MKRVTLFDINELNVAYEDASDLAEFYEGGADCCIGRFAVYKDKEEAMAEYGEDSSFFRVNAAILNIYTPKENMETVLIDCGW